MNTNINSTITIEEAEQLAEVLTAEHEAHVINDEITAHVIDDEIEAHKINEELSQVAETFDVLEADGVDLPPMSPEDYKKQEELATLQKTIRGYLKSKENHIPGKEFQCSDVAYIVQDKPHTGMWVRKEKKVVANPNMKNKSVSRKLKKNPTKYIINVF